MPRLFRENPSKMRHAKPKPKRCAHTTHHQAVLVALLRELSSVTHRTERNVAASKQKRYESENVLRNNRLLELRKNRAVQIRDSALIPILVTIK
jgi:hypothetical protein